MSLIARTAAVITMLLFTAGCSAYMSSFQSSFFYKFSLRKLVERNKSAGGLNCAPSGAGGGGGGGVATGAGGIGRNQTNFQKSESFSCQLKDAAEFDEAKFIETLKESIEQDLTANNAKIVSSKNPDDTSCYFQYEIEDIKGTVKISGTRALGNYYTLNAELEERRGGREAVSRSVMRNPNEMAFLFAFLHGEQVLVGLLLAGVIVLVGVPILLYVWVWHSKISEWKLALGYFVFTTVLCLVFGLSKNDPTSLSLLTTFSLGLILTLPWSAVLGGVIHEILDARGSVLGDGGFAIVMFFSAGVNAVLLYFIARKMRRLVK